MIKIILRRLLIGLFVMWGAASLIFVIGASRRATRHRPSPRPSQKLILAQGRHYGAKCPMDTGATPRSTLAGGGEVVRS